MLGLPNFCERLGITSCRDNSSDHRLLHHVTRDRASVSSKLKRSTASAERCTHTSCWTKRLWLMPGIATSTTFETRGLFCAVAAVRPLEAQSWAQLDCKQNSP